MFINGLTLNGRHIELRDSVPNSDNENNIFSVLIGRNGCQKSSALSDIALGCISWILNDDISTFNFPDNYQVSDEIKRDMHEHTKWKYKSFGEQIQRSSENRPNKVLAFTNGQFDKFPVIPDTGVDCIPYIHDRYVYIGASSGSGYKKNLEVRMSQLDEFLPMVFFNSENNEVNTSELLDFLNKTKEVIFHFEVAFHLSFERLTSTDHNEVQREVEKLLHFKSTARNVTLNRDDVVKINNAMQYLRSNYVHSREFTAKFDKDDNNIIHLVTLLKFGVLSIKDVYFCRGNGTEFRLSSASSGELCIIFMIASIAGTIEDNSVILIDEPEVCLHPEWQQGLLPLLEKTFSNYKNCHFILATHSPNIVSSIPESNAFIINMEDANPKAIPSKYFHNRSVDFQLARAFKAPGHSNEYLIKSAINIFSKVKRTKTFDDKDRSELKMLNEIKPYIKDTDPVIELVDMLNEVYEKYGRN